MGIIVKDRKGTANGRCVGEAVDQRLLAIS